MTMRHYFLAAAALAAPTGFAQAAFAAPKAPPQFGDAVKVSNDLIFKPLLDTRLRYERVEQPGINGDALTLRVRAGAELKVVPLHLAVLAESEATLGIVNKYNAFPYTIVDSQRRVAYATIPDPQNVELNRIQIEYRTKTASVTLGRQRINLDDQRWVGNAGWRQNEQTFDAVRGTLTLGPVNLDGTYARRQRTIFGGDAGPRTTYAGDFEFLGASARLGPVTVKAFAVLLDYADAAQAGTLAVANADTQTFGARATGGFKLAPKVKLSFAASYARQSSWQQNPQSYGADYIAGEGALGYSGWTLTGGYEKLGSALSTTGVRRAVQTPMATLHKFDGWADLFLTTPANGLRDTYVGLAKALPKVKALPGLSATVIYHRFDSDFGGVYDGNELDASLGFKLHKVTLLAKYANYNAHGLGVDTRKAWLQLEYGF